MTESNEYQSQTTGPPIDKPRDTRVHDDNYVLNELKRINYDSRDAFGKRISDGTRNNLDVASQYLFSPERLRLFLNDTRQFVQYDTIDKFTDTADTWTLQPAGGDTMHLETAESGTYVVNYVMQVSASFQVNQSLQSGDVIKIGPYNGSDGWYFEQRGSDHTDTQGDIVEERGGVRNVLAEDVELGAPVTDWQRFETRYNWYGVGNQEWRQTYTEDGEQFNDRFAETSNDGDRGPSTGNLNIWQEVTADADTTGLELQCGSMGYITLGDPTSLNRTKPQYREDDVAGTNDTWEPVLAIRIDPDNADVNMQFNDLAVINYTANATIELVAASFDDDNTDATGFTIPEYHHDNNSALESTTNVSQVARDDGTVKTLEAGEKFGGWTIAASVDVDGGNASGTAATSNQARQEKKAVLRSDHIVLLARTDTAGTLSYVWDINQNW